MTAPLRPDPALARPSAVLDPALVAAFGLVPCPAGCDGGLACVPTSPCGDVDYDRCPSCDGIGWVTGDRREDEPEPTVELVDLDGRDPWETGPEDHTSPDWSDPIYGDEPEAAA